MPMLFGVYEVEYLEGLFRLLALTVLRDYVLDAFLVYVLSAFPIGCLST